MPVKKIEQVFDIVVEILETKGIIAETPTSTTSDYFIVLLTKLTPVELEVVFKLMKEAWEARVQAMAEALKDQTENMEID